MWKLFFYPGIEIYWTLEIREKLKEWEDKKGNGSLDFLTTIWNLCDFRQHCITLEEKEGLEVGSENFSYGKN